MKDSGSEMLYTEGVRLRDQLENGMPKSDMGNPGMKPTITILTVLLFATLAVLHADDGLKPAQELKPGTRMILKFPELPQTLYAMQSGNKAMTQAYIALPENYSLERKFPLFVFLYGGHGGPGAGPGRGYQIM